LRFHQLLATIRRDEHDNYWIAVDGPLNLFYKTQKYGLNLALFFPALLHQQDWELRAEIEFKRRRKYHLALDKSSGLQPYSHQFLAYVPEEIRLFQETFHQKAQGWQIIPAANFVPLEGEFYCFPDYTLQHASGAEISLELFHPWHASHLTMRLEQLERTKTPPLIIGVSKVLLNEALAAQTVENSAYFEQYGFVFREMPTADKVLPILQRVMGRS
jgi:predicted nuclease of restriction endonuclease-like RecB superfamily